MPAGDRTGPQGDGPKTGRGLGDCDDTQSTDTRRVDRRGPGRGPGRGGGRGPGRGNGRGRR